MGQMECLKEIFYFGRVLRGANCLLVDFFSGLIRLSFGGENFKFKNVRIFINYVRVTKVVSLTNI